MSTPSGRSRGVTVQAVLVVAVTVVLAVGVAFAMLQLFTRSM